METWALLFTFARETGPIMRKEWLAKAKVNIRKTKRKMWTSMP